MRMLLIPSFNFIAGRSEPYVPYGLLSLQAVASEFPGVDIDIAYPGVESSNRKFTESNEVVDCILAELSIENYEFFGFSTVCNSLHYSLTLAQRIKEKKPSASIILGGPFVTKLAAEVLASFSFVDAIFIGEAENSFRALLTKRALRTAPYFGIPGVLSRMSPYVDAAPVDDLDDLPFITKAKDFEKWLAYERTIVADKNFAPVEATRGCPLKCSFCSTKQVWGAKVRRKSAQRLVREMGAISALRGDTFFSLTGDNVGAPRNQFLQFCHDLLKLENSYTWACSMKLDRFSPSDLELMYAAGCRGIFVGIESASQKTLDRVNKAASVENEIGNIRLAISMGFQVETSFIIGFPWETSTDLKDTFELHCEFLRLGAKRSQVGILSPIPGTEIVQDGNIVFDQVSATFSDDGIRLSSEHRELILKHPTLFSHFGSYETPFLTEIDISSYRDASAQVSGLFNLKKQRKNGFVPFAGRSANTF